MKTAVEHLQAEFNKWAEGKVFIPQDLLEKAKELEKEQIIDAYEAAMERPIDNYAEAYYNMNFNQKEEQVLDKEDKTFKQKSKWIKYYKQDGTEPNL